MKLTKRNIREKLSRDKLAREIRAIRNNPFAILSDPLFDSMPEMRKNKAPIIGLYSEAYGGTVRVWIQREMKLKGCFVQVRGNEIHFNHTWS